MTLPERTAQRAEDTRARALSQGLARFPPKGAASGTPWSWCPAPDRWAWIPGERTMTELWRAVRLSELP